MELTVHVKPGSRKTGIEKISDTEWILKIREPPVEGRANFSVIRAVAEEFKIPPSSIEIKRGQKSKTKILIIEKTQKK